MQERAFEKGKWDLCWFSDKKRDDCGVTGHVFDSCRTGACTIHFQRAKKNSNKITLKHRPHEHVIKKRPGC